MQTQCGLKLILGHILNVTELLNSTRTSRSSVSNYDIVTGTFNQTKATKIVWWANCWWRGNYSGEIRYQLCTMVMKKM